MGETLSLAKTKVYNFDKTLKNYKNALWTK